jgi:hypothetical protein
MSAMAPLYKIWIESRAKNAYIPTMSEEQQTDQEFGEIYVCFIHTVLLGSGIILHYDSRWGVGVFAIVVFCNLSIPCSTFKLC